ncbi:lipopolysaccharide kinase InaA family protein [Pseudomonas sp. F1_0610]|uniref:lipopolysaccharide kinase InaA family protein n=1 Tax=Pseudomonas sp. F1_0610 TaxID=3114284 RepID=UPI0039C07454
MSHWRLDEKYQFLADDLASLDKVFALEGVQITQDKISDVIRITRNSTDYYVKRYRNHNAHLGWRALLPKPRIKNEWQNLRRFSKWGIPTAEVVAFGLERRGMSFVRGAVVTKGIANTQDLADLANSKDARLNSPQWVELISQQVADITRRLHSHNFSHNDLKWRNILVDKDNKVYLIDCPTGMFWYGPFLQHRIIKDLACLDKVAKMVLSNTQRLRFYLAYVQRKSLIAQDKKIIYKVLNYFLGRE